jgi:hypothetical protein
MTPTTTLFQQPTNNQPNSNDERPVPRQPETETRQL